MSKEIIIGEKKENQEKLDRVQELVQKFITNQTILGNQVRLKKINNGDGNVLKIIKNEDTEVLDVRYGEDFLQINVKFTLYKKVDDIIIDKMKELADIDKDDWDRFFIEEDNNIYGAILLGINQFEEMFPKMYS